MKAQKKPSKIDANDIADIAEPAFDLFTSDAYKIFFNNVPNEFLVDIPIAKYAVIGNKLFDNAKFAMRVKKLDKFLSTLNRGEKAIEAYGKMIDEEKSTLQSLILTEIDMQTEEKQAEATGYLLEAYLLNKIDRVEFVAILAEIKYTNPIIYFINRDSISIKQADNGVVTATGPTNLIPNVFGHNTITGIGQWDSTGNYIFVITDLGKLYFEHVYKPFVIANSV